MHLSWVFYSSTKVTIVYKENPKPKRIIKSCWNIRTPSCLIPRGIFMYDKKQLSTEKEERRYERSKKVIIKGNITQSVFFKLNKVLIISNILTFVICFGIFSCFRLFSLPHRTWTDVWRHSWFIGGVPICGSHTNSKYTHECVDLCSFNCSIACPQ